MVQVASWGAYLLSRNIMTMSFAPRDTHEAQVQFALERGVPALIGIIASKRIPYPSRAFDMAHCSRCLIPWGQYSNNLITSYKYYYESLCFTFFVSISLETQAIFTIIKFFFFFDKKMALIVDSNENW